MSPMELDELLTLRWPKVVRRVMADVNADDFAKGFARSIARNGKRPNWKPSARQEWIMRQMLADYSGLLEPEPELFERD